MSGEPALALRGVSYSYGEAPFMEGIDVGFAAGRVTGIVGPNGCGKSTLLRLAAGVVACQAGRVEAAGSDLAALSPRNRARLVALMPQDTPAVSMTVRELALSGRYAHGGLLQIPSQDDRVAAEEALQLAGVADLATRPVNRLSGGQRQRAYLAMMLAQQSPVLLLDEPTSTLDIRAAHDIMALVRDVCAQRRATVALAVHDLDLALRYCDKLVVMQDGHLAAHGPAREVEAGGALERVFAVHVHRAETPAGTAWTFFPGPGRPAPPSSPPPVCGRV